MQIMKVLPIFEKSHIRRNICITLGVIATAAVVGSCSKKKPDQMAEYPEYRKAVNQYRRDLISYNNYSDDSTYFIQHAEELNDMKNHVYEYIMKEDIHNIESYTEEELEEMNGTYKMLNGVIDRNNKNIEISTGKILERSRKRVEYVRDSILFSRINK